MGCYASASSSADIFGLKVLGDAAPDPDTKVHICTIQGLVKRVLFPATPEDVPPVDQYDLMLVDECHRGYTLDREMSDAELGFRSEADYVSKYRRVIEHFDAVRIGLTATPALHTTEIFGRPIFTYGLREAVINGWLVDQEPPIRIETELSRDGIHFPKGADLPLLDPLTGTIDLTTAPADLGFEVESFNRRVVTAEFTRVICEQLAEHIDPVDPGKTLIFAASDAHADMVVSALGAAMEARHGKQDEALIRKITGSVDKPGTMIRRFRNDPAPKIAVTVDLLTTGIDVPRIVNLAFLRRVSSRILYDQMIGRATRLCPEIGGPGIDKESFRVFDAVRQSEAIGDLTEMKPVVVNPSLSFTQLLDELARVTDPEQRTLVRDQLLIRPRRRVARLSPQAAEQFAAAAGETPSETLARMRTADPADLATWVATRPGLGPILDWRPDAGRPVPLAVSFHPNAHVATTVGYGAAGRPEDYLAAFGAFLRANENGLAALSLVLRRPRDLTQADLRSLALALQEAGFSETALRSAWGEVKQTDVAARLIGFVWQAALGDALEPWAVRVQRAVEAVIKRASLTPQQQQWLRRIDTQLLLKSVADVLAVDPATEEASRPLHRLLRNEDAPSADQEARFKVWPTNVDRDRFRAVMLGDGTAKAQGGDRLAAAYAFFRHQARRWLEEAGEDAAARSTRAQALSATLRQRLWLIALNLTADDQAQVIFETLNARGTPLLPADLIKNFLLRRAEAESADPAKLYETYWRTFDVDEEYWRREVGRGHTARPRVDLFLVQFLTAKTHAVISPGQLYEAFSDWLSDTGQDQMTGQHMEEIARFATIYRELDGADDVSGDRLSICASRLRAMDFTTAMPVLLYLRADADISADDIATAAMYIESFLVRRMVCGLNTRGYGTLFTDLLGAMTDGAAGQAAAPAVAAFLAGSEKESGLWPDDAAFGQAWRSQPAYTTVRRDRLTMILRALEAAARGPKHDPVPVPKSLHVEHLMPRNWRVHWPLPAGDDDEAASARDTLLHTIGNLTLLTGKLNQALADGPWYEKRSALQHYGLMALNASLAAVVAWNETAIRARTGKLLEAALSIWPKPKPANAA